MGIGEVPPSLLHVSGGSMQSLNFSPPYCLTHNTVRQHPPLPLRWCQERLVETKDFHHHLVGTPGVQVGAEISPHLAVIKHSHLHVNQARGRNLDFYLCMAVMRQCPFLLPEKHQKLPVKTQCLNNTQSLS